MNNIPSSHHNKMTKKYDVKYIYRGHGTKVNKCVGETMYTFNAFSSGNVHAGVNIWSHDHVITSDNPAMKPMFPCDNNKYKHYCF